MSDRLDAAGELIVRPAAAPEIAAIEPLWLLLYEYQRECGMKIELSELSFEAWAASMTTMLGRFACLFVAEVRGELVGFVGGSLKTLPRHFGGSIAGLISEVFVREEARGRNIGATLVEHAVRWFSEHGASRVELQVLMNNPRARAFYARMGWAEELVQMIVQRPIG